MKDNTFLKIYKLLISDSRWVNFGSFPFGAFPCFDVVRSDVWQFLVNLLQIKSGPWPSKDLVNQLINQSNFYSANIPGEARLSGANSWISTQQQNRWSSFAKSTGHRVWQRLWGKAIKEMYLEMFFEGTTEMAEWTDSGRLFQRDDTQEWKALAPELVLTLGTDRLTPLFDLSEQGTSDAASMEWRSAGCFSWSIL